MDTLDIQPFAGDFRAAILSSSDDSKIMSLKILVECRKTTEMFKEFELESIKLFVTYNINCQSPATRQKSLALLEKCLTRLSLNIDKTQKTPALRLKRNIYLNFLNDLTEILTENLDNGANFSRRSLSLHLLAKCVEVYRRLSISLNLLHLEKLEKNLFLRLEDSYESNKQLAMNILLELSLFNDIKSTIKLDNVYELIISVKPTDSVTAAYQCEYLCRVTKSQSNRGYLKMLNWVKHILLEGLSLARSSIAIASRRNPLYGALVVIKHLLSKLDFNKLSESSWKSFISELIFLSKELTTLVGPVVNNSSPEGHLPSNFGSLSLEENGKRRDEYLDSSTKRQEPYDLKVTPQMVLICAWRTVKEVSLILGHIVLYSPLSTLINKEHIIEIGEHFKQLLSETKHRGAFEQAYIGFSKLCSRLWRESELHEFPMVWLSNLMKEISEDEKATSKMCSTRRSAGVPFLVQALITSELQVGTTKALNYCMQNLISICYDPSRPAESKVHALNILRALFRCTDLNEAVSSFITDGMICSIKGYDANSWMERNSSTLLFASLITRVFGVQKTKDSDNLNIRNKMTGRIFFLRYPRLYDFILVQLEEASKGVYEENFLGMSRISTRKLHPLMLLLSRLYPSALEGTESNLKLSDFIPFLSMCSSCKELQTRILAGKAIAAIISKDLIDDHLTNICHLISCDSSSLLPTNFLHGQILQIFFIIRANKISSDLQKTLFQSLKSVQGHCKNSIVLTCIFDIYNEILERQLVIDCVTDCEEVLGNINCDYSREESFYYPVFRKSLLIFKLHKLRLSREIDDISNELCRFETSTYEEIETKLNILLSLKTDCPDELFEIRQDEAAVAENLNQKLLINNHLSLDKLLNYVISLNIFYPECTNKAFAVYSLLDMELKFSLNELFELSSKETRYSKIPLAMCIEKLTKFESTYNVFLETIEYLKDISQPWNPHSLRFRASCIMENISCHLETALNTEHIKASVDFILLLLSLLQDDELYVRKHTSHIVSKIVGMKNDIDLLPLYAAELFMEWVANELQVRSLSQQCIRKLFDDIVLFYNNHEDFQEKNCEDLELFDKNEANVFAEPSFVLKLFCKIFSDKFDFVK